MNIVNVIPRLKGGGAARSTLDLARELVARYNVKASILSLGEADANVAQEAHDAGLEILAREDLETVTRALRAADIVHAAFWNTPEMYAWLRSALPPMRLLFTFYIHGEHPAQLITAPLFEFADTVIVTAARTLQLAVFQQNALARRARSYRIPASTQMRAAQPISVRPRAARVGYVGTVDFVKMNSRYVELCAAVHNAEIVFPIAGGGDGFKTLRHQANERGIASRFEWLGYQDDPYPVLASLDVFGYPLCHDTYATTDLILQEAMWLGVPPVILPYGGLSDLIQHNTTGLIVSESEYAQALEELARDETLRARLSANARQYAREHFGADKHAPALYAVYETAMQVEKRERVWRSEWCDARWAGASALIEAFGDAAHTLRVSLVSNDLTEIRAAEQEIARATPAQTSVGGGGILDYRRAYPNDAYLRLWAGLVFAQQNRFAFAAAEFAAARELGLPEARAKSYLSSMIAKRPIFET